MARNDVVRATHKTPPKKEAKEEQIQRLMEERERNTLYIGAPNPRSRPLDEQRTTLPARLASALPTGASRDAARMVLHGFARTGNTILKAIDVPNRVFGNTRSLLQDIYERSEANLERDAYEDRSGVPQVGEAAVHLASAGVLGKALPAVFGANVGADTYETAKYAGASEGEALAKGVGHGAVDTAIWTLGQGLASKYLPKAWQWLGREIVGAGRGAASSVTSDAVLNSLGADISGEEMAKRAVHAAWMVPLLGMLKMGGKRREEAMSLLRKARPDLAGAKADKVIETIEAEFADPKSQKVALAWVARKGANLPDDTAQIRQALEVSSKVKGLDPMSRSPFEILSNPAYARYLPKPKPQDVKAFSNMKRYPEGVIGFDVSDDAAGRQATREMINAYMSPSSNPWCLATGKDATKLGELGPGAEGYWKDHSAVPKQIFFQEVDGKLELTAFRATSRGGVGQQEYWDTSDAGYSGIPIKVKVPGDPMGRYRKMVFRPDKTAPDRIKLSSDSMRSYNAEQLRARIAEDRANLEELQRNGSDERARANVQESLQNAEQKLSELEGRDKDTVPGTFEDITPGKIYKGDPFRDGRSQTWVKTNQSSLSAAERQLDDYIRLQNEDPTNPTWKSEADAMRETVDKIRRSQQYVLVEDKVRTTENGITKFRTTKYADPPDWDYKPPKPGEQPKPVEIEESELVSPEWMRARGYDPESESDVRRMQQELNIQAWGNGVEAAMATVPTKRTYMQTKSGTPETVTYGPNGHDIVSEDFEKNGVPYRWEYFASGPADADPSSLYHAIGYDRMPFAGFFPGTNLPGARLIRNPDSASPEVLDEIKWDEGLGGFVRTSGGRRWREGTSELDYNARRHEEIVPIESRADLEGLLRRGLIDSASFDYAAAHTPDPGNHIVFNAHHGGLGEMADSEIWHSKRRPILIEDLQPDGTWAPARDVLPNANGGTTSLPPPPLAISMADIDTQVERRQVERRWMTDEADPAFLGLDPGEDAAWQRMEEGRAVPTPAPFFGGDHGYDGDAFDGEVPFALKAGRTRRNVRAAEGGGDTSGAPGASVPSSTPARSGGPRIVINPQVFNDKRDALCVAFNEAIRLVCEENGFEPVSEPTEAQRKFFADTAYADDELQLRRTILARIATLDTSVKDPTDEQLEETAEMLEMVMEVGAPQNEWEQSAVQRLHDVVVRMRESPREAVESPAPSPKEEGSVTAAMAGGRTMTRGEYEWLRNRQASGASLSTQQRNILDATVDEANKGFVHLQLTGPEPASPESSTPEPASPEPSTPEPTPAQPAQEPSTPAPKPGSMEDYISRGWHFGATGGGLERETIMGTKQYIPQNLVRAPGMRIPNKSEIDWLRRRKADGGRLSAQQEQILAYDDMMSQY